MHPKPPPEILSPTELAYMSGLNERDRRLFLAARAESLKSRGLSHRKFSKNMGISTHTLQKVLEELHSGHSLGKGRVRWDDVEAVTPRCPSIRNGCGRWSGS